eukprot:15148194-Heterocapsa_arctica.AAC.1
MPAWSCITESKSSIRCGADPNGESKTWVIWTWLCSGSMPCGSAMAANSNTSASGASTTKAFHVVSPRW